MVDFLWTHSHCVRLGNGLGRRLSFPAEITSGKAVGGGRALNPCLLIQVTFMRSRAPFEGAMNDMTGAGQFWRHEPVSPSNIPTHIGSRFKIGRAHISIPITNAHFVLRLLLETIKISYSIIH